MTYIEDNTEYEVAELICTKCLTLWIGVYPAELPLKDIECKCGEIGYVVKTGQTLPDDTVGFEESPHHPESLLTDSLLGTIVGIAPRL